MDNTFESILTDLKLFVEDVVPSIPRVLTCGKNFNNWTDGRIKSISQILLNAVVIPKAEFEMRLERLQLQIEADLNKDAILKTLSYHFDDKPSMAAVTAQLAEHYGVQLNQADLIKEMVGYSGNKGQETMCFLLITIIESHILQ